jgi:hypothetical protein
MTPSTPSAYDRAMLAAYRHGKDDGEISRLMMLAARHGVVHVDYDLMLCAIPCNADALHNGILDLAIDNADTWYVLLAAGKINDLKNLVEPLRYIAYERFDGRTRVIGWNRG